jgi:hypothetical protein
MAKPLSACEQRVRRVFVGTVLVVLSGCQHMSPYVFINDGPGFLRAQLGDGTRIELGPGEYGEKSFWRSGQDIVLFQHGKVDSPLVLRWRKFEQIRVTNEVRKVTLRMFEPF